MAELGLLPAEAGRAELGETSLAFVVVDDDCRCLDASDEARRLLGVGRAQVVGVSLDELLAEDARDRFAHVWRAFRAEGGHAGPFRIDAATPFEVDVNVTAEVLPARHVVLLSPATGNRHAVARPSNGGADGSPTPTPRWGRGEPAPTARERQILRMLAAGATDGEIAKRLSLSPATVRTHVRNAKAKLGAHTRAQAVALALERGIIEPG